MGIGGNRGKWDGLVGLIRRLHSSINRRKSQNRLRLRRKAASRRCAISRSAEKRTGSLIVRLLGSGLRGRLGSIPHRTRLACMVAEFARIRTIRCRRHVRCPNSCDSATSAACSSQHGHAKRVPRTCGIDHRDAHILAPTSNLLLTRFRPILVSQGTRRVSLSLGGPSRPFRAHMLLGWASYCLRPPVGPAEGECHFPRLLLSYGCAEREPSSSRSVRQPTRRAAKIVTSGSSLHPVADSRKFHRDGYC